jgi:hypothetical protein
MGTRGSLPASGGLCRSCLVRDGRGAFFGWGIWLLISEKPLANTFPRRIRSRVPKTPQFKTCFRPWGAEDGELLLFFSGQTYVTLREKVTMKSGGMELVDVRYPFNHA